MRKLNRIKIYTKEYCPFCIRLKSFLEDSGYKYEEVSVDKNLGLYSDLKAKTNHHTVPQVFIEEKFIGGSEEFFNYLKLIE